jgi:hypothetical protein
MTEFEYYNRLEEAEREYEERFEEQLEELNKRIDSACEILNKATEELYFQSDVISLGWTLEEFKDYMLEKVKEVL